MTAASKPATSLRRRALLVVGRPEPSSASVRAALKEFYQADFKVWGGGIRPETLEEWGIAGAETLGPADGLRSSLAALAAVRRRRLDGAVFVGRRGDLAGMGVVALSGARERLFREDAVISPRSGRVFLLSILPRLAVRLCVFAAWRVFLPVLKAAVSAFPPSPVGNARRLPPLDEEDFPSFSVVVPNYNGRKLLAECLPSLYAAFAAYPGRGELIVVDDASRDGSAAFIRDNFPEVRLIALKENAGFGRAVNLGVESAVHRRVVLLNSDIKVANDFLRPLLARLDEPDVFAVQPRMEEWDGDGLNLGLNVGRFDNGYIRIWNEKEDPALPSPSTAVPNLYAVGGAMAFDREKWRELEGFDDVYRPFCWEDIDISYRAWKRGWRVIYEPASSVRHLHHGTLSRFFTSGFKQGVERRNELLFTWKNIHSPRFWQAHWRRLPRLLLGALLTGDLPFRAGLAGAARNWRRIRRSRRAELRLSLLSDETVFRRSLLPALNRFRPPRRPRLLMINTVIPYPPEDGGKMRIYQMLKNLSSSCDIHFLCFHRSEEELANLSGVARFCRSAESVRLVPDGMGASARALIPRFCQPWICSEMSRRIRAALSAAPVDVVQMDFTLTAFYRSAVNDHPTIFVEHDAGVLLPGRSYNPSQRGWRRVLEIYEWLRSLRYELKLLPEFDRIIALNREDERLLRSYLPGLDVRTVTQGVELERFQPASPSSSGRHKMVFLGSLVHYPNIDAIGWLVEKILPLLRERVPDAELRLVGSGDPARLGGLKDRPGVEFLGRVDEVGPALSECAVFAAPLRLGSGMKGKVLEAMALAMPVVATSVGASGITARPGREIVLADDPEAFAAAVAALFEDEERRRTIGAAARALVAGEFDWKTKAREMEVIYREMIGEAYGAWARAGNTESASRDKL